MSCTCSEYQCLDIDYNICSNDIELPINATETAGWVLLVEFNGGWMRFAFEVTNGEPVVIPNVLNEYYLHTIRLLDSTKALVNDTCYKLVTKTFSGSGIGTTGSGTGPKEPYRLDFTITNATTQTFPLLVGAVLLQVEVENNDNPAVLDPDTGILTWGGSVGIGQTGFIQYKK